MTILLAVSSANAYTNVYNQINYHKKIAQCSKFCYRKSLYNRMHIVSHTVFIIHLLIIDDFTYD